MALLAGPTAILTTDTTIVAEGTARTNLIIRVTNYHATNYVNFQLYYTDDTVSADGEQCGSGDVPPREHRTFVLPSIAVGTNLVAKASAATALVIMVWGT